MKINWDIMRDYLIALGIVLTMLGFVAAVAYDEITGHAGQDPIVLVKRDGTTVPAVLNGQQLFKDPNIDAYVVLGSDMILLHNKATDEIFPISIGGMKSTMYKK